MAGTTFGQNGKTGTVYNGPAPAGRGTGYSGLAPAAALSTVYGGPGVGGTVYNGPSVYNGNSAAGTASRLFTPSNGATTNVVVAEGAGVFFVIAIVTGVKALLVYAGVSFVVSQDEQATGVSPLALLIANLVVVAIFLLLGTFARRGSKAAFVLGILLYGLDLVLLLAAGPASHIAGIVVHGLFLFYLINGFRQLA